MRESRKTLLIVALIILSLVFFCESKAQELIPYDNVQYRSTVLTTCLYDQSGIVLSETMFQIRGKKVTTTNKDQTQVIWLLEDFRSYTLKTGYPVLMAQARDHGGFDCVFTIGYDPKSGMNFIDIGYNNLDFFYECRPTLDTIPSDEIKLRPGHHVPDKIEWTEEEINEFLKNFGHMMLEDVH